MRRLVGLHLRADKEKPQNFRLFGADRCIIVIVLEKGLLGPIILAIGYGSNSVSLFFLHSSILCVNFVILIEDVLVDVFWTPMICAIVVLRTLMFYCRLSCWYAHMQIPWKYVCGPKVVPLREGNLVPSGLLKYLRTDC